MLLELFKKMCHTMFQTSFNVILRTKYRMQFVKDDFIY